MADGAGHGRDGPGSATACSPVVAAESRTSSPPTAGAGEFFRRSSAGCRA
ncbi:hypothetical protein BN2537_1135 [Streptomyces venezuelae]|nr:hypothetical protein BN2537_1135 [Streptomyces venezuelae]